MSKLEINNVIICNGCKAAKPINDFYKTHHCCKLCMSKKRGELYKKNRNKILEDMKVYRENNKNMLAKTKHKYYVDNKEKLRKYNKRYREANKHKLALGKHQYVINNIEKHLIHQAKVRAEKKNLDFSLKEGDFTIPEFCPLLNIKLELNNKPENNSITLDRVDPNKGYIKNNVWIISNKANRSKNNATIEEYEMIINNLQKLKVKIILNKNIIYNLSPILYSARIRAKRKNLSCDIDIDYLKSIYPEDGNCPLLGIKMIKNKDTSKYNSITLDRIIQNKGYVKGNVAFISHRANTIKNNLSLKEMQLLLAGWKQKLEKK